SYYVFKHNWAEAQKLYDSHKRLEPTDPWIRGNYAAWLANNGEFERAIPHARDALNLMEYGAARHTLTVSLFGAWATLKKNGKEPAKAQAYFDEAYAIQPDLRSIADGTAQYPASKIIFDMLLKSGYLENPPPHRRNN